MPKVLLVEDDNNLREIFELRLIAEGYTTVTAGNGEEALVVAMKEKPDLIITDVMMPKLSGFEMLETLRAAPEMAATKAIMMTALGQPEDRARGEQLGVVKYLVKSQVTLEDFVRVVREVLTPEAASASASAPAQQTNLEGDKSMQPDNQNQPAPNEPAAAPAPANPINDNSGSQTMSQQPSAAQEQSAVQDQINSFVNSTPAEPAAPAAPALDNGAPAAGATPQDASEDPTSAVPTPGTSADVSGGPVVQDAAASSPVATDTTAPAVPPTTQPPQSAPQPPTETGTAPAATPTQDNTL